MYDAIVFGKATIASYVWLSFYGPILFGLFFLCVSYTSGFVTSPVTASVVIASLLASPLIGSYAVFRVMQFPNRVWFHAALAWIGLVLDFCVAVFIYLPL